MNISYWFIIIAALALIASVLSVILMYKKNAISYTRIIAIWIFFIVIGAILGIVTSSAGNSIKEAKLSESFEIDPQTYNCEHYDNGSAYAFYTTDGVTFSITSDDLLKEPVESPTKLDVYVCSYYNGFAWCYTDIENAIRYVLK